MMVNRSQKEQILKHLERHYLSPLSQFYVETEVLKRLMLGRPFRAQIGVPDGWRFQHFYQKMPKISQAEALERLWLFERYLSNSKTSVFAHDKPLIIGESFPYFEWQDERLLGLNELLGQAMIFYFYKGHEESLLQFCEFAEEYGITKSAMIIGSLPEALAALPSEKGMPHIAEISKPFSESLGKGRSFTSLFSQTADLLLMDKNGTYVKSFSRPELLRQIDQLLENYFQ